MYLRLCSSILLLLLGVLANAFNLVVMLVEQRRQRPGLQGRTVGVLICFISLGNVLLQTSTCALVVSVWAGALCWPDVPLFFCIVLFVWFCSSAVSFWAVAGLSVFYCVTVLSFSSGFFRTFKDNVSNVLNVFLWVTSVTSGCMFSPFFYLQFNITDVVNVTERSGCTIRTPLFPSWINVSVYVVVFVCYLVLMPLLLMLPTSLGLVVHLCRHTSTLQKHQQGQGRGRGWGQGGGRGQGGSQAAESYLLVCRLTVVLVWVYMATLLTIALYYLHAVFSSGLSGDVLFVGLSFYCAASAMLITFSNKNLREKLTVMICREKKSSRAEEKTTLRHYSTKEKD